MQLTEIDLPKTIRQAKSILVQKGWRERKGAYASVFGHPDKNYVLKLFSSADTAYVDFVNLTKQHSNEHFPKFGNIVRVNDKYWAIKIEKLQPVTSAHTKEIRMIGNIISILKYRSYEAIVEKIKEEEGYEAWQKFVAYLDENPSMKDAIFTLMPIFKKHFNDLGASNFMLRGNVIVFTDPVEAIV